MTDLKHCPFCGGEAELVCNDIGVFVGCFHENCPIGPQTSTYLDGYDTESEAVEAWNARAERTCELIDNGTWGYPYGCSECGASFDADVNNGDFNYCPNCGSRVIG